MLRMRRVPQIAAITLNAPVLAWNAKFSTSKMNKPTDYDYFLNLAKQAAYHRQKADERSAQGLPSALNRRTVDAIEHVLDLIASIDDDYAEDVAEARRAAKQPEAKPEPKPFGFDSGGGFDHSRVK